MTKNVLIQNRIKYWIINSSLALHISRGFNFIRNLYDHQFTIIRTYMIIFDRQETFEKRTRMDVLYSTNKAIKGINWQRKEFQNLALKKSCRITRIYLITRITQTYIIVKRMVSDKNYKSIWTNLSSWKYSAT